MTKSQAQAVPLMLRNCLWHAERFVENANLSPRIATHGYYFRSLSLSLRGVIRETGTT